MNLFANLQHRLLLKYPIIWSTRIVPVIIISGAFNLLLFALFYLVSSPWETVTYETWIPFLSLFTIIAVILYLIYLLRFNAFKLFGKLHWADFGLHLLLYFIAIGSMVAWPFMPQIATHAAVSGKFTATELESDIIDAYVYANQLVYNKESLPYRMITIEIDSSIYSPEYDEPNNYRKVPSWEYVDSTGFSKMDKKSANVFIAYERIYLTCSSFPHGIYNSDSVNRMVYESLQKPNIDTSQHRQKLDQIFRKYIPSYDGSIYKSSSFYDSEYGYIEEAPSDNKACSTFKLAELGQNISRIDYTIMSGNDWEVYGRIWFYLSFYTSLLLVIFRFMTARTFLWTALFTFLLFVFSIIVNVAIGFNGDGQMFGMMLFYYFIFSGFALSIFFTKSRNVFQGVALNLSFFCLQLLPIVAVAFYYSMTHRYSASDRVMILSECIGIGFVIISALFVHSRLFYKWYSLPEE